MYRISFASQPRLFAWLIGLYISLEVSYSLPYTWLLYTTPYTEYLLLCQDCCNWCRGGATTLSKGRDYLQLLLPALNLQETFFFRWEMSWTGNQYWHKRIFWPGRCRQLTILQVYAIERYSLWMPFDSIGYWARVLHSREQVWNSITRGIGTDW